MCWFCGGGDVACGEVADIVAVDVAASGDCGAADDNGGAAADGKAASGGSCHPPLLNPGIIPVWNPCLL